MGVQCSLCQINQNDELSNFDGMKNDISLPTQANVQSKQAQKNFNEIFKIKLPQLGEYYKGNINDLIPEKIQNYITENLFDSSPYQISSKQIFESPAIEFKNGNIYKGNWNENGEMQGEGIYILKNDNAFAEGVWDKGELIGGRIFLPNGDIYEGKIENSIFNGKGKLTCVDGIIYEGNFINGERNGIFNIYYPDGSYYYGDFKNENFNGKGKFHWKKGILYIGNFSEGKLEGKGTIKNEISNSEYDGLFHNNYFEGEGIFKWNNGNFYKGNYRLNKKNGEGIYKEINGISYKGNWINGKPHGIGEFNDGKKIYKCSWRNGEPIEIPSLEVKGSLTTKMSAEDLNDLFFLPQDEDIDTNSLGYLVWDIKDGDFIPNDNF